MLRVIIILLFFSFYLPANSLPKDKIISQMKITNNLSFNFLQTINDKSEDGKCIIEYPKKIFCEYSNPSEKKLVSNGKSLVIKTSNKGSYYRYPLNKTPLEFVKYINPATIGTLSFSTIKPPVPLSGKKSLGGFCQSGH